MSSKPLNTIIPFNIKGKNAVEIAEILNNRFGIGVRAGNFCMYHAIKKMLKITNEKNIITAIKAGDISKIPSVIRVSVGLCNTEDDVKRFIEAIEEIT